MKTVAKIFGIFVLVLIGVPLLVAMIWAAGMTRAATSDQFYTDLSQKVIKRLPELMDKSFKAAQLPGAVKDSNSQAWVKAMTKAQTPLPELLDKTGIRVWLEKEVAGTIQQVGQAMRGKVAPASVSMDLRPLKQALTGPVFGDYLKQLLAQLPACDSQGIQAWKQRALSTSTHDPYPACNPGVETLNQARSYIAARVAEIPDQKPMFDEGQRLPAFDVTQTVSTFLWLFFLVPLLFIAIGSVMAGGAGRGFLTWCGGSILTGGLISLLLAGLAGGLFVPLLQLQPGGWQATGPDAWIWNTAAGQELATQITGMMGDFLEDLFSPVITYSWIATGTGLVLLILSLLIGRKSRESEDFA